MKLRLVICAALLILPSFAMDRAHFIELNEKARQQARQKDWTGLRATLLEIGHEMPSPTPTYFLRMASVEARLGNVPEAVRWMQKYADTGLKFDVAQDDDLKPLTKEPAFAAVADTMRSRTQPIQLAETVCVLPLPDLMPEDLTFDKALGAFVVSSIRHHGLYRVDLPKTTADSADCALKELSLKKDEDEQAKRWPSLAVSFDPARNLLWMTACAMPGFIGFPPSDQGKAALFAIDASNGKIVRRFDLGSAANPAVLGDMSIADGTVYVSDSIGGGVYRVQGDLNSATLEKIAGDFFSPQTPVLAADGKRLFVADYSMGIATIDLTRPNAPGQLQYLPHPESVAVTGIDGLYLAGDSLIGIQNGTDPVRIMRFRLNPAQTAIISGEVVEQSAAPLGEPTHVTRLNGWLYVSANVGWDKIDDQGNLKPGERFGLPVLLRFRESSGSIARPKPYPSRRWRSP